MLSSCDSACQYLCGSQIGTNRSPSVQSTANKSQNTALVTSPHLPPPEALKQHQLCSARRKSKTQSGRTTTLSGRGVPSRSPHAPPPRGPLRTSSCDKVNKYQPTPQCHPAFCHAFCGSGRMRHCPSQPGHTSTGSSEMIAVCLTHVQPEPGTGR